MEKQIFIYKGFDYSFMDDAGKAIMAKRIKQEEKEQAEEADSPKGILKEIWDRIENHTSFTYQAKNGNLARHIAKCKSQYGVRHQPMIIYQGAAVNPNEKNLNIINNEIDKD